MSLVGHEPFEAGRRVQDKILHGLPFPAALLLSTGAGTVLEAVNERMLIALSLPRAFAAGRPLEEVLPGTTSEQLLSVTEQSTAAHAPIRLRGYDDLASFDVIASPLSPSPPAEVLIVLEPIFQRHLLEPGRLALFEQLGPLSRGLVYVYEPLRRVHRYLQAELAQVMGLPTGQIFDVELFSAAHPEDVPDLKRHFTSLAGLKDSDVAAVTFRVRHAQTGDWVWMHARSRVLSRKPDGTPRRIIGLACDVTEERRVADQLSTVSAALGQAEESERRRIGRELHDSIAPLLVGVGLGLTELQRQMESRADPLPLLAELRAAIGASQREIRNISYMLHPPALRAVGLDQAIAEFATGFGRRTGLEITTDLTDMRSIPEAVALALFRVTQEALMNTFRHAGAGHAVVRLRREGQALLLDIEDDGVGLGHPSQAPGVGIAAMRARVEQLGGELCLTNGDLGFRVEARIPLPPA